MMAAEIGGGKRDRNDQLALTHRVVMLRFASWQPVKIGKRDAALAVGAVDINLRVQSRQRNAHIRRMNRDAGVAGTENGMNAVNATERRTSAVWLTLVAGRGG